MMPKDGPLRYTAIYQGTAEEEPEKENRRRANAKICVCIPEPTLFCTQERGNWNDQIFEETTRIKAKFLKM